MLFILYFLPCLLLFFFFFYLIALANRYKVASKRIGQVSLSPLNLKFVISIPNCCSLNLVSLSQLTQSLNCSGTFDAYSCHIGTWYRLTNWCIT